VAGREWKKIIAFMFSPRLRQKNKNITVILEKNKFVSTVFPRLWRGESGKKSLHLCFFPRLRQKKINIAVILEKSKFVSTVFPRRLAGREWQKNHCIYVFPPACGGKNQYITVILEKVNLFVGSFPAYGGERAAKKSLHLHFFPRPRREKQKYNCYT
jgi:hypothetical protein